MSLKTDPLSSSGNRLRIADASPPVIALRIKLLGGLAVEGSTGPLTGRAAQRRRLGLLAILATAQARGLGISREKLVAHLWPDADVERGRPMLSDSIYRINQAVECEAIITVGEELRLNDGVVSSDVVEFERAVATGDLERAASLYTGALLDGVHLVDGTEFERWVDGERARLARLYEEVLDALAQTAESSGAMTDAVAWWRQLAAHDPYSSRVALRLMQALAAVGDAVAALRHATVHTTLLREELGVAPNAAVLELAARLKAESEGRVSVESPTRAEPSAPTQSTVGASTAAPAEPEPAPRGAPPAPNADDLAPTTLDPRPDCRRRVLSSMVMGFALAVATMIGVAVLLSRQSRAPGLPAASVAVLPFTDLSPQHDNAYFSDGITDELTNTLAQVEGVRVAARISASTFRDGRADVREVGRRLGVATVLEGSVRKSGSKLRITAQLANAADGFQLWSATYDRELTDALTVQEDISRAIVGVLRGRLVPATTVGQTATERFVTTAR